MNPNDSKLHIDKRICKIAAIFAGVFFCIAILYLTLYRVRPVSEVFEFEIGQEVPIEAQAYIGGFAGSVRLSHVDVSAVDTNVPGTYEIIVYHLFDTIKLEAKVADSYAPVVTVCPDTLFVGNDTEYFAKDLVLEVYDNFGEVEGRIESPGGNGYTVLNDGNVIKFTENGAYVISLTFTDRCKNETSVTVPVFVKDKPQIFGMDEFYVALGTKVDLNSMIFASDDDLQDISSNITNDATDKYIEEAGDYEFNYFVTDNDGVTGTHKGIIHSYEPLILQDMVNRGELSGTSQNVFGVLNPYDMGYFVEPDIDKALEAVKGAAVHIFYSTETINSNGSGFIVNIDDKNIIVCTNKHVVEEQRYVYINLVGGYLCKGEVIATSAKPDVAFVKIPVSSITPATLKKLKTVHINENYYERLWDRPYVTLGMYVMNSDGTEKFTHYGQVLRKSGYLSEYFEGYDYACTEVSVELVKGVSGSAIIDDHGNLICMAAFYWDNKKKMEYYGVSADDIIKCYKVFLGKDICYY